MIFYNKLFMCGVFLLCVAAVPVRANTCQTGGKTFDASDVVWSKHHKSHLYCTGDNQWRYLAQWALAGDNNIFYMDGNVGIGTATPPSKLSVNGQAFFNTNSNSTPVVIGRKIMSNGNQVAALDNQNMRIGIADTETVFHYKNDEYSARIRFHIENTDTEKNNGLQANSNDILVLQGDHNGGRVGIGTVAPQSKLHISGFDNNEQNPTLTLSSTSSNPFEGGRIRFVEGSGLQGAYIHYDATGSDGLSNKLNIGMHPTADSLVSNDVDIITILRNGNMGLRYDKPQAALSFGDTHSNMADCKDAPNGYLRSDGECRNDVINIYEQSDYRYGLGIHFSTLEIYSYADTEIGKRNADGAFTPFMHINRNGRVGIGTTATPTDALQVNGDIRLGVVTEIDTGNAYGSRLHFSGGTGFPNVSNSDNIDPLWMARYNLAPDSSELRVSIGDNDHHNGDAFNIGVTRSAGGWLSRLRIEASGLVGISTETPTHLLHVNGVARSTQANFVTSSDLRVKTDIAPLTAGIDSIMRLRPVTFRYKPDYIQDKQGMDGLKRGFIAQEVEAIIPEMVTQTKENIGEGQTIDDFRVLNNSDFTPILVKAVQELKIENDALKQRLILLEAAIKK